VVAVQLHKFTVLLTARDGFVIKYLLKIFTADCHACYY